MHAGIVLATQNSLGAETLRPQADLFNLGFETAAHSVKAPYPFLA